MQNLNILQLLRVQAADDNSNGIGFTVNSTIR